MATIPTTTPAAMPALLVEWVASTGLDSDVGVARTVVTAIVRTTVEPETVMICGAIVVIAAACVAVAATEVMGDAEDGVSEEGVSDVSEDEDCDLVVEPEDDPDEDPDVELPESDPTEPSSPVSQTVHALAPPPVYC